MLPIRGIVGSSSAATHWRQETETALAVVAVLLCIGLLLYALVRRIRVPASIPLKDSPTSETQKGMELRLDLSAKLFDVGIVLLGVLWGLVLADKIQINFSRWQDVLLFVSSNLLLLLSLFFHLLYKLRVSALLWSLNRVPDIASEHVDYLFQGQWLFFLASLVTGFFTVVSVKLLGGD
jgi:hypothetical protein